MLLPVMAATMMLTLMQCAPAKSKEAYVVKSTDGKTLTFYYDAKKASRTGTVFGIDSMQIDEIDTVPAWAGNMIIPDTMLAKVNFDTSFPPQDHILLVRKLQCLETNLGHGES
mgnify:CR=1 FL=1